MNEDIVVGEEVGFSGDGERKGQTGHKIELWGVIAEGGTRIEILGFDKVWVGLGAVIAVAGEHEPAGEDIYRAVHRVAVGAVPLVAVAVCLDVVAAIVEIDFEFFPDITGSFPSEAFVVFRGTHDVVQCVRVVEYAGIGIVAVHAQAEAEDDIAERKFILDIGCVVDRPVGGYGEGAHPVGIGSGEEIFKRTIEWVP